MEPSVRNAPRARVTTGSERMIEIGHSLTRREFLGRAGLAGLAIAAPRGAMDVGRAFGRHAEKPFPHPDPRPGVTAEHVLQPDQVGDRKGVLAAYDMARANPELFDGLYCACNCHDSMGHRSLLSCFETKQPMGCVGCQDEAELVGRLAKEGKTLTEIRLAVDKAYGG
jgi:hypothetical protein